jgi:hypothetical protein
LFNAGSFTVRRAIFDLSTAASTIVLALVARSARH